MPTFRRAKGSKGFVMFRATAQDKSLSFEATGLLAYIFSLPDDWTAQLKDIERRGQIGREKRRRIVAELETAGYFERKTTRREGRIDYELLVHEKPISPDKRTRTVKVPSNLRDKNRRRVRSLP